MNRGKPKLRKTCRNTTLPITNPTQTGLGMTLGLRGVRPWAIRLRHDMAPSHVAPNGTCYLAVCRATVTRWCPGSDHASKTTFTGSTAQSLSNKHYCNQITVMKAETQKAVKAGREIIVSRYYVHFMYTVRTSKQSGKGNQLTEANGTGSDKCKTHSRRLRANNTPGVFHIVLSAV